jgi:hypothetical protein
MKRIAMLMLGALLVGCGGTTPTQPGTTTGGSGAGGTKPGETTPAPKTSPAELSQTCAGLLNKIKAGTATGAILTPEFKKHFAPPELASDTAVGYSESAATQNLKLLGNEFLVEIVSCEMIQGNTAWLLSQSKTIGTTGTALVRMVYTGGEWKIDWLQTSTKGTAVRNLNGDATANQFTALALVHAVMTRQFRLAEGLLSESGKATLGKSTFGNEFDRGALKNKLEEFFGLIDTYTVADIKKNEIVVQYMLLGQNKRATIKLDAEAKVEGIEVK